MVSFFQNKLILLPACQNVPPPGNLAALPALHQLPEHRRTLGMAEPAISFFYQCFVQCCGSGSPDPHVFGPPGSGSGSISQRYGSDSGS